MMVKNIKILLFMGLCVFTCIVAPSSELATAFKEEVLSVVEKKADRIMHVSADAQIQEMYSDCVTKPLRELEKHFSLFPDYVKNFYTPEKGIVKLPSAFLLSPGVVAASFAFYYTAPEKGTPFEWTRFGVQVAKVAAIAGIAQGAGMFLLRNHIAYRRNVGFYLDLNNRAKAHRYLDRLVTKIYEEFVAFNPLYSAVATDKELKMMLLRMYKEHCFEALLALNIP